MKGSLLILIFFLMGCLIGYFYTIGFDIHEMSVKVLYVLMLLLGMNLGGNQDLKGFVAQFNFKMLLVPIATVSGTFLFSAIAGFILSQWSVFDCMAVGSCVLFHFISPHHTAQDTEHGTASSHGIRNNCLAGQYLP